MCNWQMNIACCACREPHENVEYSVAECKSSFICKKCGQLNEIVQTFVAIPMNPQGQWRTMMVTPQQETR